jgi:hypothetical protein
MRLKKANIRLGDLPLDLQSRFLHEFSPRLNELFGIHTAWEQPKRADLQKLWSDVFPDEQGLDSRSAEGVIALKLVGDAFTVPFPD